MQYRTVGKTGIASSVIGLGAEHLDNKPYETAEVHKYLDIALLDEKNIPPGTASHYKSLENNGSSCTECGSCEQKCPFSVPVIGNMKKAVSVFK